MMRISWRRSGKWSPATSAYFTDEAYLLQRAKNNRLLGLSSLKRWFVDKYKLPPTHALFVGQTEADLRLEIYEDLVARQADLRAQLQAFRRDDGQAYNALMDQLNAVNESLGEQAEDYDAAAEQWERDLDAGLTPDFKNRKG